MRTHKNWLHKPIAIKLIVLLIAELAYPSISFALTGGPSQPEVQSFTAIDTADMVDPFSGDFNYNLPLLDVEGYPINLAYSGNVTNDQEASWVGLGWNLNPGVINRNLRGLPDDFAGDLVKKEMSVRDNKTWGLTLGTSLSSEALGKKLQLGNYNLSLGAAIGIKFNTYAGYSASISLTPGLSAGDDAKLPITANLGISASSDAGASMNPSIGMKFNTEKEANNNKVNFNGCLQIGGSFSSRGGMKELSVNVNGSMKVKHAKRSVPPTNIPFSVGTSWPTTSATYSPVGDMTYLASGINARFSIGGEVAPFFGGMDITGYASSSYLASNTLFSPAYGYMNSHERKFENELFDFNREGDGAYSTFMKDIALTNFTYDILSASGHGGGGSYRACRGDIGTVTDPSSWTNPASNVSYEIEVGAGAAAKVGGTMGFTNSYGYSGGWQQGNNLGNRYRFRGHEDGALYEPYYFKEANDRTVDANPEFITSVGGLEAVRPILKGRAYNVGTNGRYEALSSGQTSGSSNNRKTKREKRSKSLSIIRCGDINNYGVSPFNSHLVATNQGGTFYPARPSHHIGEITTLGEDGARFVYGLPAYNNLQAEYNFAIGATNSNSPDVNYNALTGLVNYNPVDASTSNRKGRDFFYTKTETPAYAHSFLLTSILSSDYVDVDGTRGPSDGDFGTYTKFEYTQLRNYKWRTPCLAYQANFSGGLLSDDQDDRANFVFGQKDLYYLRKVVTKNYIAIFTCSDRLDSREVAGEHGGIDGSCRSMKKLDKIELFNKKDYETNGANAKPIKSVHFKYSYDLCKGIENGQNTNTGKLTLTEVYFTYNGDERGAYSVYRFNYGDINSPLDNPNYNMRAYDRWGNYMPNEISEGYDPLTNQFPNSDYPYTKQNRELTDKYCASWLLKKIYLPSGGVIQIDYESDSYSTVQHLPAKCMAPIVGTGNDVAPTSQPIQAMSISAPNEPNKPLIVQLPDGVSSASECIKPGDRSFFKCLVPLGNTGRQEYVVGYSDVLSVEDYPGNKAKVTLTPVKFADDGPTEHSPISKASIAFVRKNLPQLISAIPSDSDPGLKDALIAIANSFAAMSELFANPYEYMYNKDYGKEIYTGKSVLRITSPNGNKLGGGSRVKRIVVSDQWGTMSDQNAGLLNHANGQEYSYEDENGRSTGVASYEPGIGGEENPFKVPVYYVEKIMAFPDEQHMREEPFGECFFPAPSVGYSKVTIRNIGLEDGLESNDQQNINRHGTGYKVKEFYTAKDFPTITERTGLNDPRERTNPLSLASLLKLRIRDFQTLSQGFYIENNDMHGKPKSEYVYDANGSLVSSVVYKYKSMPITMDGQLVNKLKNDVTVIDNKGNVNPVGVLGVNVDVVNDARQFGSLTENFELKINADVTIFGIPLPSVWPLFNREETRASIIATTKVAYRFGIIDEVIATEDGSTVSTRNLAYDSETGQPILTQTINDYNDHVYTLNYPAYWHYREMGPAYKNIGFRKKLSVGADGVAPVYNAKSFYVEGDELKTAFGKAWVVTVGNDYISLVKVNGEPFYPTSGEFDTEIIRSGFRNMQAGSMASITTKANPINSLKTNVYASVLQASAIEYTNEWPTVCSCFDDGNLTASTNPYVLGIKGYWKPSRSYLHLSGRTQSNTNGNSDIRKDGEFTSYNPFYKWIPGGEWSKDYNNWTYTSEVTRFSPYGQELENRDALGRYSSAKFGHKQTLPTAVAANAAYGEVYFDSFEDRSQQGAANCADEDFRVPLQQSQLSTEASHSGRYSAKVTNYINMTLNQNAVCSGNNCNPVVEYVQSNSNNGTITIKNGSGAYTYEWLVQFGQPIVTESINPLGQVVLSVSGSNWMILVHGQDSNGTPFNTLVNYEN